MYIYKILNSCNSKIYIGATTQTLEQRFKAHLYECNRGSQMLLYKAMRKYGTINFYIELVDDTADSLDKLRELENYYIDLYEAKNPKKGYNVVSNNYGASHYVSNSNGLTDADIQYIRTAYAQKKWGPRKFWNDHYKDKMSFSGFEKIWQGATWQHIMPEVYTEENIKFYRHVSKMQGGYNGNALYTNEEVLEMRKYFVNHTIDETYEKYGQKYKVKQSFASMIGGHSYKNIPIYKKKGVNKWFLNGKEIDIEKYNPVSTILESEE